MAKTTNQLELKGVNVYVKNGKQFMIMNFENEDGTKFMSFVSIPLVKYALANPHNIKGE